MARGVSNEWVLAALARSLPCLNEYIMGRELHIMLFLKDTEQTITMITPSVRRKLTVEIEYVHRLVCCHSIGLATSPIHDVVQCRHVSQKSSHKCSVGLMRTGVITISVSGDVFLQALGSLMNQDTDHTPRSWDAGDSRVRIGHE
jgi:hypothetical protein